MFRSTDTLERDPGSISLPPYEASAAGLGGGIRFEFVEGASALDALAGEWDELHRECPCASLCAGRAWVESWWRAYGNEPEGAGRDTALLLGIARDPWRRLVGVLPLFEERARGRVRRLRSVGFLGREGVYDMTEEPAVLLRPGFESSVLRAFAESLRPHLRRGRWDLVFFRAFEGGEEPLERVFAPLRPGSWVGSDRIGGPFVARLPSLWAEYRRTLTKSMRDNLGYYPRLLTRRGHDWRVRTLRDPKEVREAAGRLADLHVARSAQTRGRKHSNHVHGPIQREFLATLLERTASEGTGFVAELVVGDEVVASQAFFERGNELMVFYSGYLEAWYDHSPVFVIDAAVLQESQARGVRRVNFLRARSAWKTRWGAVEGRPIHRVFVVPLRPGSVARALAYILGVLWSRDVVARVPRLIRKTRERLARRFRPAKPARGR